MKVYISSTFEDLREHRAAVQKALRRMGHDVISMEEYGAEAAKPLARCREDVRAADVYLIVLAWRYGYVPPDDNPDKQSVTRLEFEEAKRAGKPVLAFMVDPNAPWPPSQIDAISPDNDAAEAIRSFRDEVGMNYLAGIFRTADELASQAAAAVAVRGLNLHMVERLLSQTAVSADEMGGFGQGDVLFDSTLGEISRMVARAGSFRALVIDLGDGDRWWSTRLYLLANLLRSLTAVRQLVFRQAGRFVGMASPAAVVDGLAEAFPLLDEFARRLGQGESTQDSARETDRQLTQWENFLKMRNDTVVEIDVKVGVRPELLRSWIGERLVTRCVRIDESGPTMAQVQQIVDSLIPDVPIERQQSSPMASSPAESSAPKSDWVLQVVDRNAFAVEIAREWVQSSLPRVTIR